MVLEQRAEVGHGGRVVFVVPGQRHIGIQDRICLFLSK
jgi:hypothetical protein